MKSGLFGEPQGDVTVEVPDGVTKVIRDHPYNSLTNADWAYGGPDGRGYGAFPGESDEMNAICGPSNPDNRFRVG